MKKVYRLEFPWYFILVLFVILAELLFLIYSIISMKRSNSLDFIYQNVAVNIVLLVISSLFLRSLIKKHILFEYDKEMIKDSRRDINVLWEDIESYKIDKFASNSDVSLTIDSLNKDDNYILEITNNKSREYIILLGSINRYKRNKISRILKHNLKNVGKKS